MVSRTFSISLALAATLSAGCATYLPFTQELRNEHKLRAEHLQNLQFYNSHDIQLRRELARGDSQVTGSHKLLLIAGKQIEEVLVEKHTPGVIVGVSETSLRVSFEEGTSLEFAVRGAEPLRDPIAPGGFATPPDPFPGNNPDEPVRPEPSGFFPGSGNYWLLPFEGGRIQFQGKAYDAVGDTSLAHLVISTESLEEVDEERKVLPGRKLSSFGLGTL
jgi:hypothetical protein